MLLNNHFYFYWLYNRENYRHLYNVGSGVFIWLFLLFTLPFGVYDNNLGGPVNLAIFLLPFGVLWTIICYTVDLISSRLVGPDRSNKVNLNFFLWIVKVTVLVHLIFVIRGWLCSWQCIDTMEYAQLWLACALLFSFTYIPFTLYGRYRYFHSLVGMDQREGNQLTLKGEGKESLTLSPDQIIFIQSDDNYVDIFLAEESQPGRKIVFRCTLKSLESQLSAYPQFMRIHRSMLANVKYALNPFAHGRPKEIQLVFKDYKVALPISKSYLDSVESLFTHPK